MRLIPLEIAKLSDDMGYIWKYQISKFTNQKISKKKLKILLESGVDFFIENGKVYTYGQKGIANEEEPYYKIELQKDFEEKIKNYLK